MKETTVDVYMTKSPVIVKEDDTLTKAWELLDEHSFAHLPVIDDKGNVTGMLSATDISNFKKFFSYLEKNYESISVNLSVKDVMSTPVEVAYPDSSIEEANDKMLAKNIHALPVVREKMVIGIISESDILRFYNDKYNS